MKTADKGRARSSFTQEQRIRMLESRVDALVGQLNGEPSLLSGYRGNDETAAADAVESDPTDDGNQP